MSPSYFLKIHLCYLSFKYERNAHLWSCFFTCYLHQHAQNKTHNIYFYITLPSPPRPSKLSLAFRITHKSLAGTHLLSHTRHMRPLNFFLIDHPNNIWRGVKIMKIVTMHFSSFSFYIVHLRSKCHPQYHNLSQRHGTSSGCGWRKGLRIWTVAANTLNKQPRIADKGWSSSLQVGRAANNSSLLYLKMLRNTVKDLGLCIHQQEYNIFCFLIFSLSFFLVLWCWSGPIDVLGLNTFC